MKCRCSESEDIETKAKLRIFCKCEVPEIKEIVMHNARKKVRKENNKNQQVKKMTQNATQM